MKLYTAEELAERYQVHKKTIYRLGREGKLITRRVGRSVRFAEPRGRREHDKREIEAESALQ